MYITYLVGLCNGVACPFVPLLRCPCAMAKDVVCAVEVCWFCCKYSFQLA